MLFRTGNYNLADDILHNDLVATEEAFERTVIPSIERLWEGMVGRNADVKYEALDMKFEFDEANSALPTSLGFRLTFVLEDFQSDVKVDDGAVEKDSKTIAEYFSQFDGVTCSTEDVEIDTATGTCRITVHLPVSSTSFVLDELKAEKEEEERKEAERLNPSKDEEKDEYGFNLL